MLNAPNDKSKLEKYKNLNTKVKKAIKAQKKTNMQNKIEEIEIEFKTNKSHNLFKHVREIEETGRKPFSAIKDKTGNTHTNKTEVLKCWQDHFKNHLNTKFPHDPEALADILEPAQDSNSQWKITKDLVKAIAKTRNHKAPGIDVITAEVLKSGGEPMVAMLYKIFNAVYDTEKPHKN